MKSEYFLALALQLLQLIEKRRKNVLHTISRAIRADEMVRHEIFHT